MSRPRIKVPESLRGAYAAARRSGWLVIKTSSGHLKWIPPDGKFIITASTPAGGSRGKENDLSRLRAAGLRC